MLPKELNVQVDRSLPLNTIVVSAYAVLDLIEGEQTLAAFKEKLERGEVDEVLTPVRRVTKRAPRAHKPVRRYKKRRTNGGRHKPRTRRGHASVQDALNAYALKGHLLEDVEKYVFCRYYGADNHRRVSLGTIGERIGYTSTTMGRVLAKAQRTLGLPHSELLASVNIQYGPLRKAMKIVPGSDNHGTVIAGKVDPTAVRHAVKQNMEARR